MNPLVPPDLDLRNLAFMPLDVARLRDSDIARQESGESFRAAVLLWCAAWHQVPAASLPNDDVLLASYAGFGRDLKGWRKVKDGALHGFVECSDGRLYHSVIAEKAIEADAKRNAYRNRTKNATEARWKRDGLRNGHDTDCNTDVSVSVSVRDKEKKDNKYAFESGVIRLSEKHFNQWKSLFSYLDVPAELLGLSKWASEQGSNWFHAVSGALAKRNREAKERLAEKPKFRTMSGMDGII